MKQKLHTKTINRDFYSTLSERLVTLSKINQVRIKLLFMALLFSTLSLNGQFVGWPGSNTSPEVDYSGTETISTKIFMDENRARVVSMSLVSTNPDIYDLTLSASNLCALDFPADKWCLLIQMEDNTANNVGNHCRVTVTSYNCVTGILTIEAPVNGLPLFSTNINDILQLIRVPVYWNMELETNGEITCNPYDHSTGTGGVVAFVVGNQLDFNGGIINASTKGYHISWKNINNTTLGEGGLGNIAQPFNSNNTGGYIGGPYAGPISISYSPLTGIPPPAGTFPPTGITNNQLHGYLCSPSGQGNRSDFHQLDLPDAPPQSITITSGGNGNSANNGSLNSGGSTDFSNMNIFSPNSPSRSTSWSVLRMGDAGMPGSQGGDGGGAGGHGGTGGDNSSPGFGLPGFFGGDGGQGGTAADAARGGGIILLKVYDYTINVTSGKKFLFVDGEHGKNAYVGGDGGRGGDGGLGANGTCDPSNTIVPPGGIGGFGESGIGAQGGEGGKGGNSGTVWIMKNSISTPSLASHVSMRGGVGGGGGNGGYTTGWLTLPLANNYEYMGNVGDISVLQCNPKGWQFCQPPLPVIDLEICNCDKVFEQILDLSQGDGLNLISGTREMASMSVPSKYSVYFDIHRGQPVLYYIDGSNQTRYNCYMYKNSTFEYMVNKMFGVHDLLKYDYGGSYLTNKITEATNNNGKIQLVSEDDNNEKWDVFEYEFALGNRGILTDLDDPSNLIVWTGNCSYVNAGIGTLGGNWSPYDPIPPIEYKEVTGESGDDGDDGDGGEFPYEFFEDGGAPLIFPSDKKNYRDKSTNDNLVAVQIIELQDGSKNYIEIKALGGLEADINYTLYSIDGKLINASSFKEKLILNGLSSGIYILNISTDNKHETYKLFIQ